MTRSLPIPRSFARALLGVLAAAVAFLAPMPGADATVTKIWYTNCTNTGVGPAGAGVTLTIERRPEGGWYFGNRKQPAPCHGQQVLPIPTPPGTVNTWFETIFTNDDLAALCAAEDLSFTVSLQVFNEVWDDGDSNVKALVRGTGEEFALTLEKRTAERTVVGGGVFQRVQGSGTCASGDADYRGSLSIYDPVTQPPDGL